MNSSCSQTRPRRALSHSWTVKQQCVDLLAEGLWEELLDDEQPDITVMDWYMPLPHPVARRAPQSASLSLTLTSLLARAPLQDPLAAAGASTAYLSGSFSLRLPVCARPEAIPSSLDACPSLFSR